MASQTIKGLTIQISGDTTKLGTAVKDAENKSKSLGKELSEVNKLLKEPDANAVELLAQKQQILTERISATKEKLDILKAAQASVQAQFDKGDITAEQYRAFQREIQYTANAMQGYEKAIQQTTKQLAEAKVKTGEEASSLDMLKAKISLQEQELSKLTDQYKNVVIAEGKNSTEAKNLATQIKTLSTEHQNEKVKLQEAEKATESITVAEKTLTERYKDQKSELSALKQQYVNVVAQYGTNSKEAKALAKQISSLSGEIAKEDKKIQSAEKSADKFDKTLVDTSSDSNKTAKNIEKLGDSAKDAENGFTAAAVAVGTFMGNLALNVLNDAANLMKQIADGALDTGASFEAAMSQVAATQGFSISDIQNNVEGAAYTMDLLTEKAREMGAATSFSAAQASDGLNILLMSGYSAENSIEMVENVLHEAEAGNISIAEAAKYIAGSMKGFKKQSAEFADSAEASAYYADLIAKGATLAATNVPELGQSLSGVAATANIYNQKADSVTVSLLRLAEQGEVGAGAATALTAAMKNLYSPTDTAKAALEELGISAYDAEGNTRDFNVVVGELDNALSQLTEERRNSLEDAIFGIQGQAAFDKMVVTSGDKLQKFYDGIAEANGSAALQSETMLDNLKGDITKLQSAYSDLEITIYNGANEPLRHVVQTITDDMLPAINHLVSGAEDADKEVGAAVGRLVSTILTEIKGLLPGVTNVANSILLTLMENLPQMAGGFGEMAMTLLNGLTDILPKMLPAMSKSIQQIISKAFSNIKNLAGIVKKLVEILAGTFLNELPKLGATLAKAVETITQKLIPAFSKQFPELLKTILGLITKNLPALLTSLKIAVQSLLSGLTPILSELIPELLKVIVQFLNDGIPIILNATTDLFGAILDALPDLITALAAVLPDIVTTIIDVLLGNVPVVLDSATALLMAIVNALPQILEALTTALPQIVEKLIDFFTSEDNLQKILDSAFTLLSAMLDCIPDVTSQLVIATADIVMAILTAIGEKLPDMAQKGAELFESLIEKGAEIIQKIILFVPQLITSITGAISEHFQDLQDAGMNMFHQIGEGIKNMISGAYDWGADLIDNFITGIFGGENEITKAAENIGERIWEYLHFSEPEKGKLADFSTYAPDMMATFANGINENAGLVVNQLIDFSSRMAEQAQNTGKQFLNGVLNYTEKLPGNLGVHLTNTVNNVIDWGKNLKQKASSATLDMVNTVENIARGLPDKMTEVGRNLVLGLWNGMNSLQSWILSNTSDFCNNILNQIYDTFDIHSPAKTMVYVGEMLDYGVAGGVTENQNEPIRAIRQMAHNLLNETAVIPERLPVQQQQYQVPDMQTIATNSILSEKLDRILQAIENGQVLMLDGNKLVGATADRMNSALGQIQLLSARR